MPFSSQSVRRTRFPLNRRVQRLVTAAAGLTLGASTVLAQTAIQAPAQASGAPAAQPAGTDTPKPTPKAAVSEPHPVTQKQADAAEDAFLSGAKAIQKHDLVLAEDRFAEAVRLNPTRREYTMALAVTRGHRLQGLLQQASKDRLLGREAEANALLAQARQLDPTNAIVAQHFGTTVEPVPEPPPINSRFGADTAMLAGPPEFAPTAGLRSFHTRGAPIDLLNRVYGAWNVRLQQDGDIHPQTQSLDLDNVDFNTATRIVQQLTHTFAVPVDGTLGIVSPDTPDARERLTPLVEETLTIPGSSADELKDYANLARNVFELRSVSTSSATGALVLKGDENTLKLLNATYADLLDGGADVQFDCTFVEVDTTRTRNIGINMPSGISGFAVVQEIQSLITANQSLIQEAIAAGLLTLTGDANKDELLELEFLLASGQVTSSEFTNLLGFLGSYGGLPLTGVYLTGTTTANFSLNSSDIRILDAITLRAGDRQKVTFRAGERYPIETGIYSSGGSSALTSALAGVTVNGQSVSSLLGASSSISVPQFQYEDLGITLNATPQVGRDNEVHLQLEFKLEALGSGTINTVPILNSRAMTTAVTVPAGKTAVLVSQLSRQETKTLSGTPLLNDIPGFGGTNNDTEVDTGELLIILTPHIVREKRMHIASRRLAMDKPPLRGQ